MNQDKCINFRLFTLPAIVYTLKICDDVQFLDSKTQVVLKFSIATPNMLIDTRINLAKYYAWWLLVYVTTHEVH